MRRRAMSVGAAAHLLLGLYSLCAAALVAVCSWYHLVVCPAAAPAPPASARGPWVALEAVALPTGLEAPSAAAGS